MSRRPRFALALSLAGAAPGCGDPCCVIDSRPIPLRAGARGELLVLAASGEAAPGWAMLDTGTPLTLRAGDPGRAARATLRVFGAPPADIGASAGAAPPLRATVYGVAVVPARLGAVELGAGAAPLAVGALIGGDVLARFSTEVDFSLPAVTFWTRQPADSAFLAAAGYAVIEAARVGGGELDVTGAGDGLGPAGPHQFSSSLLVTRACAAPPAFDRAAPLPDACCAGQERALAGGADLSLLVATGVGPLVLGRSAWQRIRARAPGLAPGVAGPLLVATSATPIAAEWSRLPRLALVDREASDSANPGPCVELARARRLEQVAWRHAQSSDVAACVLPCDVDPADLRRAPADRRAQNSAAYAELGGDLDVAVIADTEPLLQTLRALVRPEGPEIDGLLGAGALRAARMEIDYQSQPSRIIFACTTADPGMCRSIGRCPRLTARGQTHHCFGLPPHGLPRMCDNSAASSCR